MLKHLQQNIQEWLEGIRRPHQDVSVTFLLHFRDLEVGRLSFEGGLWKFEYSDAFREQAELKPLTDFPDLNRVYWDEDLWPFFTQRIPSLQQPAVRAYMRKRQIDEVDQVTLLRRFGQRTVANPFELDVLGAPS
jgi:HipA-like protein